MFLCTNHHFLTTTMHARIHRASTATLHLLLAHHHFLTTTFFYLSFTFFFCPSAHSSVNNNKPYWKTAHLPMNLQKNKKLQLHSNKLSSLTFRVPSFSAAYPPLTPDFISASAGETGSLCLKKRFNPYPPGYSYVSSASRDPDTRTRVGGPSTGIRVHE